MPRSKLFDREEALNKAMNVFWSKGYHATSMQDLVETMGINRSSMYDTFGDKHALFLEALKSYKNEYGISDQYLAIDSSASAIKTLVKDYVQSILADGEKKGCFMLNCTTELSNYDSQVKEILLENLKNLKTVLSTLILKAQQEGSIASNKPPSELSDYLIAGLQGMRMLALLDMNKTALKKYSENLLEPIFA